MTLDFIRTKNNRIGFDWRWIAAVIQLGIVCMVTQVIVVRELLAVFYGNELVIGIVLANWMILTAIGSLAGRWTVRLKQKEKWFIAFLWILNVLPVLTIFLMNVVKDAFLPYGVMMNLDEIMFSSLIILFPFCFLSGLTFVFGSIMAHEKFQSNLTGLVYSYESAGSAVGSIVFNCVLIYFLPVVQLLTILFFINDVLLLWVMKPVMSRMVQLFIGSTSAVMIFVLISRDWDLVKRQHAFRGQKILYFHDTPYGNITITEQDGQINFYENQTWLGSSGDVQANEETAHFVMIQHPAPKRVMVIGGGMTGLLDEILKYHVDRIDYLDINPWWLSDTSIFHPSMFNHHVQLIRDEPRRFIRQSHENYDVVMINIPDPTTAALNRFFTFEFLKELNPRLDSNSVITYGLSSSADYMSEPKRRTHSVIVHTLSKYFNHVMILPGMKDYVIASRKPLRDDVSGRISELQVPTKYVNAFYIQDNWLRQRSQYIHSVMDTVQSMNYDFKPMAYYEQIRLWLSSVGFSHWIYITALAILILLIILHAVPVSIGLFTAGWTGASVEVLALISFQIIFANIYFMLGLLITVFMTGLALGSWLMGKYQKRINTPMYSALLLILGISSVAFVTCIMAIADRMPHPVFIYSVIMFMLMIVSALTGMIFTSATKLRHDSVGQSAAALYGMDLIGSGIGVLVMTVFIYPLWGMWNAGWTLTGMNVIAAIIVYSFYLKRKNNGSKN